MLTLDEIIRDEIARSGPLTFARYMGLALYHPTLGYYAGGDAGREPLGWSGDYFTSGDVSPLWGWALARQLRQMWEVLGRPMRFDVVEAGAGRGLLAREVWRFARFSAPEWGAALHYTLVDSSAGMVPQMGETRLAPTIGPTRETGRASLAPTMSEHAPPGSSLFQGRRARLAEGLARLEVPVDRVRWVASLDQLASFPTLGLSAPAEDGQAGADAKSAQATGEAGLAPTVAASGSPLPSRANAGPGAPPLVGEGGGRAVAPPANHLPSRPGAPPLVGEGGGEAVIGCILSNELIDALPVHLMEVVGEHTPRLAEVYVDVGVNGRLVERLQEPSSSVVADYLDRFGVPWRTYGPGWRAEICLTAEEWMRTAAATLERGFVLTIDYGASARRLYTPDRRHGTLAVYARHQFGDRPLVAPGHQDITAHVNFSALARAGSDCGLHVAGYTTQAAFLRRLGVRAAAELIGKQRYPAADSERESDRGQAALLRRRMLEGAAATLLDPRGLGGFRVLVQQRGIPTAGHELIGLPRG